ncbi:DNA cytosine methyltransferase [Lactococcus cremoris]|uniref:DNA cytosine methyltransferase n=1 Tax=Lactococcus lactis subsp. cremoris TaxID=1359 RepID=UPI0007AE67EB|nr:DNA cytosine methyltransferase [Lactococcus cremoris]KZK10652.1 DNA-cytosine methyltransferase [Lactococcus cremoris]MDU8932064.1 Modification methylase BanI [Lactococcus cremoris]
MKFLDLFAGIGGFRLGLEQAGHECVGFCEIDKFARQSYKSIHNTEGEREYHDITTVRNEEWRTLRGTVELICGGFPCQSFSIAGKRKGFLDETRGTLFFEIARAAEQIKPRTLFLENVRGLLSHDKGRTFRTIISTLNELGYDAEWQILNSKNFGVPQNRERVFIIGHLRGERGREVFPITRENSGAIKRIVNGRESHGHSTYDVFGTDGISPTLKTMQGGNLQPKILVNVNPSGNGINGNVYDSERLAPTLTTNKGEGPKIAIKVKEATKQGFAVAELGDSINFSVPNSKTRRGRVGKQVAQTLDTSCNQAVIVQNPLKGKTKNGWHFEQNVFDVEGLARTLKAGGGSGNIPKIVQKPRGFNKGGEHEVAPTLSSNSWHENNLLKSGIRIRKLTPRECWRLQGFPDWAFEKAQEVNSNSQLYKQAGNSVTVPVIYEIARRFE